MLRKGLSRAMFRILNSADFQPIDLLEIRLAGADPDSEALRLVGNYGQPLTWNGHVWTPFNISHGDLQDVMTAESGASPAVTIVVTSVDLQVAELLNDVKIEGARATLRILDRRRLSLTGDQLLVTTGEVRNPSLNPQALIFEITNVSTMLEECTIPRRMFQLGCNATFGSRSCGADLTASPNQSTCVAQAGTSRECVVVPGAITALGGADPTDFFANGYVWVIDGPAATQASPIQFIDASTNTFWLQRPFTVNPGAGSNLIIRRGCRKTLPDCTVRQGNADQFQGYPYTPFGRLRPEQYNEPESPAHNPAGGPID